MAIQQFNVQAQLILAVTSQQPVREAALNRITALATSVVQPLGLSLLDVRLSQQGRRRSLEVCIFRRTGEAVGLADCEQVSRALDQALEEEAQKSGSPLEGAFLLEVVSPGIDRQLKSVREFECFAGSQIKVIARENIGELGSEFVCLLLSGNETHLSVSDARPLSGSNRKISKSKGSSKTLSRPQLERSENLSGESFQLELERVFKVNLYPEGVKKEKSPRAE